MLWLRESLNSLFIQSISHLKLKTRSVTQNALRFKLIGHVLLWDRYNQLGIHIVRIIGVAIAQCCP